MYRDVIAGLLKVRDIPGSGEHHVYTALCRSVTRYMDMSEGMALRDYDDVTSIVDTLPETPLPLFTVNDSKESYRFWFECVCKVVEIVVHDDHYEFETTDLEGLFRHLLSRQYWDQIYTRPVTDVSEFVIRHYLMPYIGLQGLHR